MGCLDTENCEPFFFVVVVDDDGPDLLKEIGHQPQ